MPEISIEVIVLNWNRSRLLKVALDSIFATFPAVKRISVIDNASEDTSRDVIDGYSMFCPQIEKYYYGENLGAEPINEVWKNVCSDLVLILANDKKLLPGWAEYCRQVFSEFQDLGQLALHPPVPDDNEVWITKPSVPVKRNGASLFRAVGNTGMSSVLRASIIGSGVIKFGNVAPTSEAPELRLPNDGMLSKRISELGYFSAWSNKSFCVNIGHTIEEFVADWEYYSNNYKGKPALGLSGMKARIDQFHAQPKPVRKSRLAAWSILPEASCCEGMVPPARSWSMLEIGTPPLEVLEFIYGFIRLEKPEKVLIVGGASRYLVEIVVGALKDNGHGHAVVAEDDEYYKNDIHEMVASCGFGKFVSQVSSDEAEQLRPNVVLLLGFHESCRSYVHVLKNDSIMQASHIFVDSSVVLVDAELCALFSNYGFTAVDYRGPRSFRQFAKPL
ncbi:hypothetical protein DVDV_3321 [Desulfovibrio sp. DV]|uniref:glycosyltransferase n=1 Tax=Desulfovibrio sp. DV TaxID=1844708 RepID=UPI00095B3CA3|nr:glycosyltransferase [Desulfovibrio sp. DV]OLN25475.1 hypothetical protein DVDV_3321 [Desulfovibrio sp. DV]